MKEVMSKPEIGGTIISSLDDLRWLGEEKLVSCEGTNPLRYKTAKWSNYCC